MLCLVNILHQQHPGKVIYAGMASLLLKDPLEGLLTHFKARSLRTPFFLALFFSISKGRMQHSPREPLIALGVRASLEIYVKIEHF